jgi:hypothetical protein
MRNAFSTSQLVFAGAMMFVLALGVSALLTSAEAGGCRCPLIYAPVTCDHDKTYPNQCEADCHHAKNCVPSGVLVQ